MDGTNNAPSSSGQNVARQSPVFEPTLNDDEEEEHFSREASHDANQVEQEEPTIEDELESMFQSDDEQDDNIDNNESVHDLMTQLAELERE